MFIDVLKLNFCSDTFNSFPIQHRCRIEKSDIFQNMKKVTFEKKSLKK